MADVPSGGGGHGGSGLSHKLGPLPIWGWMVVAVGAYLLYHYLHKKATSSTTSTGTVAGSTGARGISPITITPTGTILTATTGNKIGQTNVGSTSSVMTGQDWLDNAQSFLQGLGYSSTQVDTALQNYLAGKKLSVTTYNIVTIATKGIGHPPVTLGVPQSGGTPPAAAVIPTTGSSAAPPTSGPANPIPAAPGTIVGKIVAVIAQPTGGADYVTTGGYVYSVGGAGYYGGTAGGAIGGVPGSHIVSATQAPGGGYTLVNEQGQTYTFDPQSNYAPGGNAYKPEYGGA